MLEAVIFDLGNVLLRFCHERMCRQLGALCGRSAEQIRADLLDSGLLWQFERGAISQDEFHQQFSELVQRELILADLLLAGSDIFEELPGMLPIVDDLKARGIRLVLMSNTSSAHFDFIRERFEVVHRFDKWILSYEVGAAKPDAPIYEAAIAAANAAPERIFYTDDIPEYVAAGRQHGLHAEVFTDPETLKRQINERMQAGG